MGGKQRILLPRGRIAARIRLVDNATVRKSFAVNVASSSIDCNYTTPVGDECKGNLPIIRSIDRGRTVSRTFPTDKPLCLHPRSAT